MNTVHVMASKRRCQFELPLIADEGLDGLLTDVRKIGDRSSRAEIVGALVWRATERKSAAALAKTIREYRVAVSVAPKRAPRKHPPGPRP
jgi:hypothetical protein